ncbi:MAG: RNA polymerase factor sigma-54 [Hyphomicrobiales bacterium]|nr:RNA polymerase factor sigma-54 [Hyphomicrobiales bacterium]
MAMSPRLVMRTSQSLVMTPQLLQAIRLLQFSSLELATFVDAELERNPLLERIDTSEAPLNEAAFEAAEPQAAPDWASSTIEIDAGRLAENLGTGLDNAIEPDAAPARSQDPFTSSQPLTTGQWSAGGGGSAEAQDIEAFVAETISLQEHLQRQLALATSDPLERAIGQVLIDGIDEAGYHTEPLGEIGQRLGISEQKVGQVLKLLQGFEPAGIAARDLAECLALQLIERNRFDPAMQALVAHLPLLAKREFGQLRRLCGVDDADLADMIAEIRRLDPKPGRAFASAPMAPVIADVLVSAAADGGWQVELNQDALPKLLVNQSYAARITRGGVAEHDRLFINNCLQTATWLTKSLEQRAKTILKVATEIVRQQDGFLTYGIAHLRPLNLKTVAAAISMHESTVSRVTASKYMATPRGLFELKYFFSGGIASGDGSEARSSEAVRHRIRELIDAESVEDVLSDDALVARLKSEGIDIARRTVAKYRESLRLASSAQRRREKRALMSRRAS